MSVKKIICVCMLAASVAHAQQLASVKVTPEVLRPAADIEPLGVNYFGDGGAIKYSSGNLIALSAFEPVTLRRLHRVTDSGTESGRHWISLDGPGTSTWQLFNDGAFSGASLRAYRFVDGEGKPLPYTNTNWAGDLLDPKNATSMVHVFSTTVLPHGTPGLPRGGWTVVPDDVVNALPEREQSARRAQGRVYYEGGQVLRRDDVVIFERSFIWPDLEDFHPRMRNSGVQSSWFTFKGKLRHVELPGDAPAEMEGGKAALQLLPAGGEAQVWYPLFHGRTGNDARWYGLLEEGLKYRYQAWVKAPAGTWFELGFGGNRSAGLAQGYYGTKLSKRFEATGKWQKLVYDFVGPATPEEGPIEGAIIRYEGSEPCLVDNVLLRGIRNPGDEDKPFVIDAPLFKELMNSQPTTGRKGAGRVWGGLSDSPMTSLCSWTPSSQLVPPNGLRVGSHSPITFPKALMVFEATGDSPETRMVPWLITQIMHSEEEHRQLVEYLAAPYDPAVDSPETKPLAHMRWTQRGHGRPWTDDFREIIIEFGNENWHNRKMWEWVGVGRYAHIHGAGKEMGLWGKYMIEEMKKSPYWNDKVLKISFGGNYTADVKPDGSVVGYAQEGTVAAGGANDHHSHATYVGPRWETGEASQITIDDIGVQKTLLSYRSGLDREWAKQQQAHERLREMGFDVRMTAYEGGPSGFGLRAKSQDQDRAGEYYGKSSAMGTAMLDAWLDAWAKGWTYQCYLSFGQGRWWNSHTSLLQGFRASPGFKTLVLVNRTMANADLLKTEVSGAKELTAPASRGAGRGNQEAVIKISAIQAHATGGASRVAVALSNLDLESDHEVEIAVPLSSVSKVTRHFFSGEVRDTNLESLKVDLREESLSVERLTDGKLRLSVPAGSAMVVVFQR